MVAVTTCRSGASPAYAKTDRFWETKAGGQDTQQAQVTSSKPEAAQAEQGARPGGNAHARGLLDLIF